MDTKAPHRLLRGFAATAVVLCLSMGAHVAGGGVLPAPAILGLLGALTLAAVMGASRRSFRAVPLLALLGAGQLVLHEAFAVLSVPVSCVPVSGPHHGMDSSGAGISCAPLEAAAHVHSTAGAVPALALLAAHAAATAATAVVLARGEDALWATAAWLRPLFQVPAPAPVLTPFYLSFPEAAPGPRLELHCPPRLLRGPPAALFSA